MEYSHKELRQEMVDVCLESLHEGMFTGTSGNLSVALEDGTMLITPTSVRYTVMRPMDIVRCDLDGNIIEGDLQPSSEWRMHAAIYRAYPEYKAIFHTHSPYATAFAVVHKPIASSVSCGFRISMWTVSTVGWPLSGMPLMYTGTPR